MQFRYKFTGKREDVKTFLQKIERWMDTTQESEEDVMIRMLNGAVDDKIVQQYEHQYPRRKLKMSWSRFRKWLTSRYQAQQDVTQLRNAMKCFRQKDMECD